jgi:hypothetical protein
MDIRGSSCSSPSQADGRPRDAAPCYRSVCEADAGAPRQAVQLRGERDGPSGHAACTRRKRRARPPRALPRALDGLRMKYRSECSVSQVSWVTSAGAFVQPAGPAPRAPFERCHAQRPCLRKLPTALQRAGYQVSGKKVAGPISTRFRSGSIGRRLLRSASILARRPRVVPLRPQMKSPAMPSNNAIKLTVRVVTRRACARRAPTRPAAYRVR